MGCCKTQKNMVGSKNYIKSRDLSEEIKLKAVENLEAVSKTILAPDRKSMGVLFDIFNEHINPFPSDKNCSSCNSSIYKFWKGTVNQWRRERLI